VIIPQLIMDLLVHCSFSCFVLNP